MGYRSRKQLLKKEREEKVHIQKDLEGCKRGETCLVEMRSPEWRKEDEVKAEV